jgi:hypothetical protein
MITYKRKCKESPCFWEDDVERKWEEKKLDHWDKAIYECPECGRPSLRITLCKDGLIAQIWDVRGGMTIDPSFWTQGIIDKYVGETNDKATEV